MSNSCLLGINVDHVATLREVRKATYPQPLLIAQLSIANGADSITVHLREDRRHIQEHDVLSIRELVKAPLNLEMAATDAMLSFALKVQPDYCCLVPEKRAEITTEGGLDVLAAQSYLTDYCVKLKARNIRVSLFIDPDQRQIDAAVACGAPMIELHTGQYAESHGDEQLAHLQQLQEMARYAHSKGLIVNAGHGLNYENVMPVAAISEIHELNIGHSIVAHAVTVGIAQAVSEMKALLIQARKSTSY